MDNTQPRTFPNDAATQRSTLIAPIRDVRLPAHITEQSIPELDEERLHARAERYRYRDEGGAYKGHVRGILTGAFLGTALGGVFGAITYGALSGLAAIGAFGLSAVALPALPIMMMGFMACGVFMGVKGFGSVGSAAGAMSYNLAEKHARSLVKSTLISKGPGKENELDEPSFEGRYGHHFEVPPDRDASTPYHWKTGAIGAGIGASLGGIIAGAGSLAPVAFGELLLTAGHAVPALAAILTPAALPLVAVGAFAVFGATFGINRSLFRSVFNLTDGWVKGSVGGNDLPTVEKELAKARTPEEREQIRVQLKAEYETALRRQEKIHELDESYYKKIFWHSVGGRFNGLMGGNLIGMTVGAALGLVVGGLAIAAGVATGGIAPAVVLGGLAMAGTTVGGLMGQEIFAETGTMSGMTSMGKAIDEEFERTQALRAKGITPTVSKMPKDNGIINFKSLALCTVVGLAAGAALWPVLSTVGLFAGLHGAAGIAASSISVGLIGAAYGIKAKVLQAFGDFSQKLYSGNLFGKDGTEYAQEHEKTRVPDASFVKQPAVSRGAVEPITSEDVKKLNTQVDGRPVNFANTLAAQAAQPLLQQR
jgi:hypothetical protein